MADNIKDGIMKKRNQMSSEQHLRELLNSAASKSLKQFILRLESGEIPIDNMSDFIRVLGAYKEINDISNTLDGAAGAGALPELDMKQEKIIRDSVEEGKIMTTSDDGEDRFDVSKMSEDEVSDMLRQFDIEQNKKNEGTF